MCSLSCLEHMTFWLLFDAQPTELQEYSILGSSSVTIRDSCQTYKSSLYWNHTEFFRLYHFDYSCSSVGRVVFWTVGPGFESNHGQKREPDVAPSFLHQVWFEPNCKNFESWTPENNFKLIFNSYKFFGRKCRLTIACRLWKPNLLVLVLH